MPSRSPKSASENVPFACAFVFLAFWLALLCLKIALTNRLNYRSLLMDEDIYCTTFWRSDWAGHFELNSWSISTLIGYYYLWKAWAFAFGTSLFAMRLLSSAMGLGGLIAGYFIVRMGGIARSAAWFWALTILGIPALFLAQYFLTDAPVFGLHLVFWAIILAVPRSRFPLWLILTGFGLITFASIIRQTALFSGVGAWIWLMLPASGTNRAGRLASTLGLCFCLLVAMACTLRVDRDPLNKIGKKNTAYSEVNFSLSNPASHTPGKILLASDQMLGGILTVAAIPLALAGAVLMANRFQILRRSRWAWVGLGLAALILLPTAFSQYKHGGALLLSAGFALNALNGWDYGGPSDQVSGLTIPLVFLLGAGGLTLLLKCFGLANLTDALAQSLHDGQKRRQFLLAGLSTLPALVNIAASYWHGLIVNPRYLLPLLTAPLILGPAWWLGSSGKVRSSTIGWLAAGLFAVLGICNDLQYRDALQLGITSWSAREQYQNEHPGFPDVRPEPGWIAGHNTTGSLARRFPQEAPKLWLQGKDYPLILMQLDPLGKESEITADVVTVPLDVWFPPKQVAYRAMGETITASP